MRRRWKLSEQGDLNSVIGFWLAANEAGRLAARLDRTSDSELERLSTTWPSLRRTPREDSSGCRGEGLPGFVHARVNEGKSQPVLLRRFVEHRESEETTYYQRPGLDAQWRALVGDIRRKHHRKSVCAWL
jgi:hypothetical protein